MTDNATDTTETITFSVPGPPKGQGRPRFARIGAFVRTYDRAESRDWKSKVALFAKAAGVRLIGGPVAISAVAFLARPKRLMRKRDEDGAITATSKPDVDNILKAVQDGLTGIAYADDAQIVEATILKMYHAKPSGPETTVSVGPARKVVLHAP